jgi:hypothetical protein
LKHWVGPNVTMPMTRRVMEDLLEFPGPKRGKISPTQARPGTKASGLVGCVGLRLASRVIFEPHLRSIVLGTSLPDTKASRPASGRV